MWAYVSFFASHWELVVVNIVGLAVLAYVAFVLKNWKLAAAGLIIACCGLVYQHADIAGYKRRVAEDVAKQTQTYKDRIDVLNKVASSHGAETLKDATDVDKLQKVASDTPKNDNACFDRAAAGRVRGVSDNGRPDSKESIASRARRHSGLFSRK